MVSKRRIRVILSWVHFIQLVNAEDFNYYFTLFKTIEIEFSNPFIPTLHKFIGQRKRLT